VLLDFTDFYLNLWLQSEYRVQDIGFTVELKNLNCTRRFSGYFPNRCRIKSLRYVALRSH